MYFINVLVMYKGIMIKSGGLWSQTAWLSFLGVIAISPIAAVVEELAPVNLEV